MRTRCGLWLLFVLDLAWGPAIARADSIVIEPPNNCQVAADGTWRLDGKRTVAVALAALAELTCESYVVPRTMAARAVVLALGKERQPSSVLRQRVAARLTEVLGVELLQDLRVYRLGAPVAAPLAQAMERGIVCEAVRGLPKWTCRLDRALLDRIWADTDGLARSVRIVPKVENGAPIGFQLFGVRPGGVVARFGLSNGDVITHVNGIAIGSPHQALAAYSTLRGANEIVVEGRRGDTALRIAIVVN